jgi:hypothetical protein
MIDRITEKKFPFDSKLSKGSSSLRPPADLPPHVVVVVVVVDVTGVASKRFPTARSLPVPTIFKFENQAKTGNSEAEKPNSKPETSPIDQDPQHPTQLELRKFARIPDGAQHCNKLHPKP